MKITASQLCDTVEKGPPLLGGCEEQFLLRERLSLSSTTWWGIYGHALFYYVLWIYFGGY